MTEERDKLEQKFTELSRKSGVKNWRSAEFLESLSKKYEIADLALSHRLQQRAKNLNPSDQNIVRLDELSKRVRMGKTEKMDSESQQLSDTDEKVNGFQNLLHFERIAESIKNLNYFVVLVVIPIVLFSFYQLFWASDRFESQMQVIVKQADNVSTFDPSLALLSGIGVSSSGNDLYIVKAFIHSNDMLMYLENKIGLFSHYSDDNYDFFSRLGSEASREDKLDFYRQHVNVEIDESSGVASIFVQAFDPEFALNIATNIAQRSEWYINEIGHELAKSQLKFVENEHFLVEKRLSDAKQKLLSFQRKYNLLDPTAEGTAIQQIAYKLEAEISIKQTELATLSASMSRSAPQVKYILNQIDSLQEQLQKERNRLTNSMGSKSESNSETSVGEVLTQFSEYKIAMELAIQAYTSSQILLEKSRIEAYKQLKYLITLESPTLPEEATYPRNLYNIVLFLVILFMIFGIGKIILATARELQ